MVKVQETDVFRAWRARLKDGKTRSIIAARLNRLAYGLTGDAKPVGEGVSELRIDHGPGIRIYFLKHGDMIVVLLCAGTKGTQVKDIQLAKRMAKEWREQDGTETH
jgi:putative addiction module killer protein